MICRDCRWDHDGQPENCPDTCTCQHHPTGTCIPKPPEPKQIGWMCSGCDLALDDEDERCHCLNPEVERIPIFEHEVI